MPGSLIHNLDWRKKISQAANTLATTAVPVTISEHRRGLESGQAMQPPTHSTGPNKLQSFEPTPHPIPFPSKLTMLCGSACYNAMSLSLSSHTAKGEDVAPLLPPLLPPSPLSTSGVPGILGGATSPDNTPLPGLGGTVGPPLLCSPDEAGTTFFNGEFCAEAASWCDPSGGNRDISSAKLDTGLEFPAPTSRPTTPALNVGFFEGLRACAALPT
jgi:hypothetical protein